jgi:putative NADH-flavin reductase
MKLLVIGASHGIGKCLTEQALANGHQVTAFARNPASLAPYHNNLTTFVGDISDADAVVRAMKGHDAVCVSIGIAPTLKPVTVFSQGTTNVIHAMQKHSVKTIVGVTGIGAGDSKNKGGFLYDRIFNPLLLKTIYEDKDRQEEIIRQSGLEWMIVRPGFLTNGPQTGSYRILTDLNNVKVGKISRADVAHFILKELAEKKYFGQSPLLTY